MEIWKSLSNEYKVSNLGRVKKNRKLIKSNMSSKYSQVKIKIDGKRKTVSVHRLVAVCFLENPLNMRFVNHIDGNKFNNKVENLKWSFRKNKYESKLNSIQICFINENRYKYTLDYFSKLFNVSKGTISRALRNETT